MSQTREQPAQRSPIATALYLNAGLLAAILLVLLSRGSASSLLPAAMAQPANIAGGNGVFLMPGQIGPTTWGVYLLDTDAQSLMVYQYTPGDSQLRLKAARTFKHDRKLQRYNVGDPTPDAVRDLIEREQQATTRGSTN